MTKMKRFFAFGFSVIIGLCVCRSLVIVVDYYRNIWWFDLSVIMVLETVTRLICIEILGDLGLLMTAVKIGYQFDAVTELGDDT